MVLPVKEQLRRVGQKWTEIVDEVTFVVVSPWDHDILFGKMKNRDADSLGTIVSDCLVFTTECKKKKPR